MSGRKQYTVPLPLKEAVSLYSPTPRAYLLGSCRWFSLSRSYAGAGFWNILTREDRLVVGGIGYDSKELAFSSGCPCEGAGRGDSKS